MERRNPPHAIAFLQHLNLNPLSGFRNHSDVLCSTIRADLNPSLTQTYINYWTSTLLPSGRLDEAERLLQAAVRTDPLSAIVHLELGFLKLIAGRFDEAIDHDTRARALDPDLSNLNPATGESTDICREVL